MLDKLEKLVNQAEREAEIEKLRGLEKTISELPKHLEYLARAGLRKHIVFHFSAPARFFRHMPRAGTYPNGLYVIEQIKARFGLEATIEHDFCFPISAMCDWSLVIRW